MIVASALGYTFGREGLAHLRCPIAAAADGQACPRYPEPINDESAGARGPPLHAFDYERLAHTRMPGPLCDFVVAGAPIERANVPMRLTVCPGPKRAVT